MLFSVIIGNPPYQIDDGGHGASASPIYHLFIGASKRLSPRFISMIIPARWYAAGKGLDDFRTEMLADTAICDLVDIPDASEVFPGVELKGGACYFLRDAEREAAGCSVRSMRGGELGPETVRRLDAFGVLVRDCRAISIIEKVTRAHDGDFLDSIVSRRKPFGMEANFTDISDAPFECAHYVYARGRTGYVDARHVRDRDDRLNVWKVFVSKASSTERVSRKIIGKPIVAAPGECCTETYLTIGAFDCEDNARSCAEYLMTRTACFLISQRRTSHNFKASSCAFVPLMDFSRSWSDDDLAAHFGLSDDDVAHIVRSVDEILLPRHMRQILKG